MLTNNRSRALIVVLSCWAVGLASARASGPDLSWNVIAGGGGSSAGGTYTLSGTAGQAVASAINASAGGNSMLTSGFWSAILLTCYGLAPADFNADCAVDDQDLLVFEACAQGADVLYNAAPLPQGCTLTPDGSGHIAADFDHDGDVDMNDFATFQRCWSGSLPADPNCAN